MKTTIEIADGVFSRAKELAAKEGVPLRVIIEEGLRLAIARRAQQPRFKLRDGSVTGRGLQPGQSWELPRDLAYESEP